MKLPEYVIEEEFDKCSDSEDGLVYSGDDESSGSSNDNSNDCLLNIDFPKGSLQGSNVYVVRKFSILLSYYIEIWYVLFFFFL